MGMTIFLLALGFGLLGSPLVAERQLSSTHPYLSEPGKQRIMENLAQLDENIYATTQNIARANHNLTTLRAELEELRAMQTKFEALRRKFDQYVREARAAYDENNKKLQSVSRGKAQLEARGNALEKHEYETLYALDHQVKAHADWQRDASQKLNHGKNLLAAATKNLYQIQGRFGPLKRSLFNWESQVTRLQKLHRVFLGWKSEYEKLVNKK